MKNKATFEIMEPSTISTKVVIMKIEKATKTKFSEFKYMHCCAGCLNLRHKILPIQYKKLLIIMSELDEKYVF